MMNKPETFLHLFACVRPWSGEVPGGHVVDFLGTLTHVNLLLAGMTTSEFEAYFGFSAASAGGRFIQTKLPQFAGGKNGEGWFEAVDWLAAAHAAKGAFTMATLGSSYGAQAVGSWRALQALNPLPCKLIAVDPVPGNLELLERHFKVNGINAADHWIVPAALSDSTDPVLFPIGAPASGSQNCISTNHPKEREKYFNDIVQAGTTTQALRDILLHNTTKIMHTLVAGRDYEAEVKFVSAVSLKELLGPFDFVDYLEADIQQSEIVVFPKFMDLLRKKVRRIHIGTHGQEAHRLLHTLFAKNGWEIVFSYEPERLHQSRLGTFTTNDGILTVLNPDL
jgi:hypothetical protein